MLQEVRATKIHTEGYSTAYQVIAEDENSTIVSINGGLNLFLRNKAKQIVFYPLLAGTRPILLTRLR